MFFAFLLILCGFVLLFLSESDTSLKDDSEEYIRLNLLGLVVLSVGGDCLDFVSDSPFL